MDPTPKPPFTPQPDPPNMRVLYTFPVPLSQWHHQGSPGPGAIEARVIERNGRVLLDLREHIQVGPGEWLWTSRGLRFSLAELERLVKLLEVAIPQVANLTAAKQSEGEPK